MKALSAIVIVLLVLTGYALYESFHQVSDISCETLPPEGQYMVGIYGHSLDLTQDGGFIVAGYIKYLSRGKTDHDMWVMRANSSGDKVWCKTFGGPSTDRAWAVKEVANGDFLVVGESFSFGKYYQAMVLKLDDSGQQKWLRLLGSDKDTHGKGLAILADGSALIAGITHSDSIKRAKYFSSEVGSDGEIVYETSFNHELPGGATALAILKSDDVVLVGNLQGEADHALDFGILRINEDLEVIHSHRFGSIQSDEAKAIIAHTDGGYLVTGTAYKDKINKRDVVVYKFNARDELEWEHYFGGPGEDGGEQIIATADGGFAILGTTRSFGAGYKDVYLIKTDEDGQPEWSQTFGGEKTDWGYDIKQTPDRGYMISAGSKSTGQNATDIWIIKLDKTGAREWDKVYCSPDNP